MDFLLPDQYYQQLVFTIPKAKSRVLLAAMTFLCDQTTAPILQLAEAALERGVRVHILLDVFGLNPLFAGNRGLSIVGRLRANRATRQFLDTIRRKGATVSVVGKLGLNPYRNRCHTKLTVVDDQVWSFGGINFDGLSFRHADYMLSIKQSALADRLETLLSDIASNPLLPDTAYEIPDQLGTVLLDGGQPGESIIYEKACQLAKNAKHVYYVSQMPPTGALGQAISDTEHSCYFNRPRLRSDFSGNLVSLSFLVDSMTAGITNHYHKPKYIHAKFMLFAMNDGTRTLLSGSNNFSWRGVAYGTKEIALYSTDSQLWQQLYNFMQQDIA